MKLVIDGINTAENIEIKAISGDLDYISAESSAFPPLFHLQSGEKEPDTNHIQIATHLILNRHLPSLMTVNRKVPLAPCYMSCHGSSRFVRFVKVEERQGLHRKASILIQGLEGGWEEGKGLKLQLGNLVI